MHLQKSIHPPRRLTAPCVPCPSARPPVRSLPRPARRVRAPPKCPAARAFPASPCPPCACPTQVPGHPCVGSSRSVYSDRHEGLSLRNSSLASCIFGQARGRRPYISCSPFVFLCLLWLCLASPLLPLPSCIFGRAQGRCPYIPCSPFVAHLLCFCAFCGSSPSRMGLSACHTVLAMMRWPWGLGWMWSGRFRVAMPPTPSSRKGMSGM